MQVFTSAALNYVPKARVLAHSVKRHHPEAKFHLVLCDPLPAWLAQSPEPFDTILPVEQLPIPDVRRWIFFHNLVELCTAVKGAAARAIMQEHPGEPVLYFDPDIVLFARSTASCRPSAGTTSCSRPIRPNLRPPSTPCSTTK